MKEKIKVIEKNKQSKNLKRGGDYMEKGWWVGLETDQVKTFRLGKLKHELGVGNEGKARKKASK